MKKYKINEIFYSLQAEGYHAGAAAIFIRLSGCNLKCPWCDTQHDDGVFMTKDEIEKEVINICGDLRPMIVFTGGEPTLQLDNSEELLPGFYRTIETNGTNEVPSWIDWVTCSPKTDMDFSNKKRKPDEIKVVFERRRIDYFKKLKSLDGWLFVQPLELGGKMNINETVDFIKENPRFKLSLQFHKIIGIK